MSSETVSDGRLDELIAEYGRIAPYVGATNTFRDMMSALTELKSLRAQQDEPPAGCAEMATTIEKAIADADESGFDEGRCGIIQKAIAPLFVIPQGCAELARELSDLADDHVFCDQDGSAWVRSEYRKAVAAKLAPPFTLLAEFRHRYAALRTAILEPGIKDHFMEIVKRQGAAIEAMDATVAKLDAALGKGDADGGREEGKSE